MQKISQAAQTVLFPVGAAIVFLVVLAILVMTEPLYRPRQSFYAAAAGVLWCLSKPIEWYRNWAVRYWYYSRIEQWLHWTVVQPAMAILEAKRRELIAHICGSG